MDKKSVIKLAKKYLSFLKEKNYKIQKAYLFGSYAKGNFNPDSDIDLAIVMKNLKNSFWMQGDLLFLGSAFDSRIEPHPYDEKDFNDDNPLVDQILKTGIQIL
jgi:predicted nucleotidyltransferase